MQGAARDSIGPLIIALCRKLRNPCYRGATATPNQYTSLPPQASGQEETNGKYGGDWH
jgi:hypothetical protein